MVRVLTGSSTLWFAVWARAAVAQDSTVPSTWRQPESSLSASARVQLAQEAATPLIQTIQPDNGTNHQLNTWESANLLAVIANNDYLSRTSMNDQLIMNSLVAFTLSHPLWYDTQVPRNVTSDPLMWGLAAYYASRAYGNATALAYSRAIWTEAFQYFVTPADAIQGTMGKKSGEFSSTCSGHGTAGAVFWQASTPTDFQVNGETVGAFMALSAYLCEATSNSTYCDSATLSAEFMQNIMYNGEYIIDTISLDTCETKTDGWSYNTGFLLEGLAVLLSAPAASGPAKEQFGSFLQSLVASSVAFSAWTQPSGDTAGVMIENAATNPFTNEVKGVYKTIFIRGLHEVFTRSASFNNSGMTNFIGSFLTVQYNALTELASNAAAAANIYSPVWIGPAVATLLPWGQIPAIEVLNAAISVNRSATVPTTVGSTAISATSTASTTQLLPGSTAVAQSKSSSSTSRATVVEIVVPSVIGGLALLGVVGYLLYAVSTKGWTGTKEMVARGWGNRGTLGSTALGSDTGVNHTGAAGRDVENMQEAPVFVEPPPVMTKLSPLRRSDFIQGSSTRPEFVQGSSLIGKGANALGISIGSR